MVRNSLAKVVKYPYTNFSADGTKLPLLMQGFMEFVPLYIEVLIVVVILGSRKRPAFATTFPIISCSDNFL